jgi:hypothetical protein
LTSQTDRPVLIRQCTARVCISAKSGRPALAATARRIQTNPNFLEEGPVSHPILLSSSFVASANNHALRPKTAKITEPNEKPQFTGRKPISATEPDDNTKLLFLS